MWGGAFGERGIIWMSVWRMRRWAQPACSPLAVYVLATCPSLASLIYHIEFFCISSASRLHLVFTLPVSRLHRRLVFSWMSGV